MLNLLLVEDDRVEVMTLKRALMRAGIRHTLLEARNGVEALQLLREGRMTAEPQVVLADVNMPLMGGLEFLGELRRDPQLSHTVVAMLTTSQAESDVRAAHGLNVAGYFVKPLDFEKFQDFLRSFDAYWAKSFFR